MNNNLGLSIVGGSSGIFAARPLFIHSNKEENRLNLYLKNTLKNNSGSLKSETNWNINTLSNDIISNTSAGRFEYNMTDFSSNKYDSYYDSNRGNTSIGYTITSDWSINDIALQKNIMAISYKDWTSIEKYTTELEDKIISCYISPVKYYQSSSITETYPLYEIDVSWASASPYCLTTGGTLTITYEYGEEIRTVDISIPASPVPGGSNIETIYSTASTVTLSYTNPDGWLTNPMGCVTQSVSSTSTIDITTTIPPPPGSILRGGRYILPSELDPKLTNFLLPVPTSRLKDDNFDWMNFRMPNGFEVPDYSDIFLDITYDYNTGPNSDYIYEIVQEGDQRRIYSFGGFIRINNFISGLLDTAIINSKSDIIEDNEFKWYIIVKDDGTYYSIGLSHYVTWNYEYKTEYPYPESSILSFDEYEMVDYRFISVQSIKLIKTAVYPKCGKIDIFRPAKGIVQSFSGQVITSISHGLSTGDKIKIVGGRGNNSNINGIRYIERIDNDRFSIFYDIDRAYPCLIINTSSGGIEWRAIENNSWKYLFTLYSPVGKNGYSLSSNLNKTIENISLDGHMIDIAIESDSDKPQSNLQGLISWNNYYPFERFSEDEDVVFEIINGNKFGSAIDIQEYNDGYLLTVSEAGANESFPIISSYETSTEEYKPKNKKLAPYYFPYGRLHFFYIDNNYNISYLMSYDRQDNPWISYENSNRIGKFYGDYLHSNFPLSQLQLETYQNAGNSYWTGAKIVQWAKNYYYDSSFNFEMPDQSAAWNYYGYLDNFGKDISVSIIDNKVNVVALTNVKSMNYDLNLISTVYCHFQIDIDFSLGGKIISYNHLSSGYYSSSISDQKQKYSSINKTFSSQDKNIIGWGVGVVFISTLQSTYQLKNSIYNVIDDIDISNDLLILKSGQSLDVYKELNGNYNNYNSIEINCNSFTLYNDFLICKTTTEYVGYIFNRFSDQYELKFNKPNSVGLGLIKISNTDATSFFDTSSEYDIGDIHKSLNIVSAGTNGIYNYFSVMDIQELDYLPLIVKTYSTTGSDINLFQLAGGTSEGGMDLFLSPITPVTSSVNLTIKQYDSGNNNIQLFTCVENVGINSSLDLFIGTRSNTISIPLINLGYTDPVYYKDQSMSLFIRNSHPNMIVYPSPYSGADPVIPDNYGLFPMYISSTLSEAISGGISLSMNKDSKSINRSLDLYQNANTNFYTLPFYMSASGYGHGSILGQSIPLFMGRNSEDGLSLVVYNTTTTRNIPLYIRGGLIGNSSMDLCMSGYHRPSYTLNAYVRGAL